MAAGHRLSERFSATGEAAPFRRRERHRGRASQQITRLSIIIVNFCQWQNTFELVEQLRQSNSFREGRADIVIADNHSPSDPLCDQLRSTEGVTIRQFARNLGFARAVNEACHLSRGHWVLLLNPDMRVEPGFLDRVEAEIRKMDKESNRIGVVGFRLRHGDGTRQASSGPFPTFMRTITGLFAPRALRKCKLNSARKPTHVPWVTGCCLLVRRECLQELQGFDEDYFLYYEDVDFCRRAKQADWNVMYNPRIEVTHFHPLHTREVPAPLRVMTRHALLMYSWKHWPRWQAILLCGMVWLEAKYRLYQKPSEQANQDLRQLFYFFINDDRIGLHDVIHENAGRLEDLAANNRL
ncbi:glycosyltransferase family 2 protein [Telmatocola sphagniphila]|uniref:Glycosyltransferase family 2 protein n=1 Tax=Telmatocola sphagniphila TaxID=1123043 RepID=A0A8E6ETT9_9BACT|nr:glycosyltransferase family 2 protein [Telmatocola sphagniphila]QVL30397.1 glycosyltransferase family 2 protein [Telmatocola sphagniphila]